jgi:hypothetical protein
LHEFDFLLTSLMSAKNTETPELVDIVESPRDCSSNLRGHAKEPLRALPHLSHLLTSNSGFAGSASVVGHFQHVSQ